MNTNIRFLLYHRKENDKESCLRWFLNAITYRNENLYFIEVCGIGLKYKKSSYRKKLILVGKKDYRYINEHTSKLHLCSGIRPIKF